MESHKLNLLKNYWELKKLQNQKKCVSLHIQLKSMPNY